MKMKVKLHKKAKICENAETPLIYAPCPKIQIVLIR